MPQFPINEVRKLTDTALAALCGDTKILTFGCQHGVDVDGLETQDTQGIKLICSGMLPPSLVEYALSNGADGVMIAGCRHTDCYYRFGNRWMEQRMASTRHPVLRARADAERIHIQGGAITDSPAVDKALNEFRQRLSVLEKPDTGLDRSYVGNE